MKRTLTIAMLAIIVLLIGGYWGAKTYLGGVAREEMVAEIEKSSLVSQASIGSMDVGVFGSKAQANDVSLVFKGFEDPLQIESVTLKEVEAHDDIPGRMHLILDGVGLNPEDDLFAFLKPVARELGYETVTARMELNYLYDPSHKRFKVNTLRLEAADVGDVTVRSEILNIDLAAAVQGAGGKNPGQLLLSLPMASLAGGEIEYRDDSLVNRIFSAEARRQQQPVSAVVDRQVAQYQASLKDQSHPQVKAALEGIKAFLKDPDHISVTLHPESPVPFLQFIWVKEFSDLVKLLNLKIEV